MQDASAGRRYCFTYEMSPRHGRNALRKQTAPSKKQKKKPLTYVNGFDQATGFQSAKLLLTTSNTSLDKLPESRIRTSSAFISAWRALSYLRQRVNGAS